MPIEDVFTISGRGTVVTGRIEQGIVKTGEEIEIIRSDGKNSIRREDALEIHPEDAAALGVAPGEMIEVATQTHRIRGMARTTGTLRGVVSATVLFGELASALDSSNDYDPMLRIPGLHVLPVQVEKVPS